MEIKFANADDLISVMNMAGVLRATAVKLSKSGQPHALFGRNPGREMADQWEPVVEEFAQVFVVQNGNKFGPIFIGWNLEQALPWESILHRSKQWEGWDTHAQTTIEPANEGRTLEDIRKVVAEYVHWNQELPNDYLTGQPFEATGEDENLPKWVQAESVARAVPEGMYVNVTYDGQTFKMARQGWNNAEFDKTKSDVLVQNRSGLWLRIWFYNEDIEPYEKQ